VKETDKDEATVNTLQLTMSLAANEPPDELAEEPPDDPSHDPSDNTPDDD
jgi:hypothetical protein